MCTYLNDFVGEQAWDSILQLCTSFQMSCNQISRQYIVLGISKKVLAPMYKIKNFFFFGWK